MTTEPDQENSDIESGADDYVRRELYVARREAYRWKFLARQAEKRADYTASTSVWRVSTLLRQLQGLRPHLYRLLIIGLLALITLPLWPLFAPLLLLSEVRDYLWRQLQKQPDFLDTLMLVKHAILPRHGEAKVAVVSAPVLRHTPSAVRSGQPERSEEQILASLSPYTRYQLKKLDFGSEMPGGVDSTDCLRSLSRAESDSLRLLIRVSEDAPQA